MDQLRDVLQSICDAANTYLNNIDRRPDDWVVMTTIVDHDGTINENARGKIVMGVYNITREAFASSYAPTQRSGQGSEADGALAVVPPPIYLDIHLIFIANFGGKVYADGLAALSRLIGFFQQTQVVTPQSLPGLSPLVDKLTLDLETLDPVDVNYVMGMLGTRYLPSAFYKLRMIPFAAGAMLARAFAVAAATPAVAAR